MKKKKEKVNNSFNYKYVLIILLLSLFIPSFFKINKVVTEKVQDLIEEKIYIPSSPEIQAREEGWVKENVVYVSKDAASRHGIAYYEYCVREDEDFSKCEWQRSDTKNAIISKSGIYNVVFRAVNNKDRHSKNSNVVTVYIDNEAPEFDNDNLKITVYDNKFELSLAGKDSDSGLDKIYYSFDDVNYEFFTGIIEGLKPNTEYNLYIKLVDRAGNSKTLKMSLKTLRKGQTPVISGEDEEIDETDNFIPKISLEDVPSEITFEDSYQLPTSYKFGKTGGNVTCLVDGDSYTDTKDLPIGPQTITCSATGNNGLTTTISKDIMVNTMVAKEEIWDGYILLNLYYPSRSTKRMWRLNNKDIIRDGSNDSEWQDYTGPIMVRVEDVANVLIKYEIDGTEKVDTKGDALVDIRPNSYAIYNFDNTKVEIIYDANADTKEYSLDGGDTWQDYTGSFYVGPNSIIMARVTKTINTYDRAGDIIFSKKMTNTDQVYISEIPYQTEELFGKVDIEITASPNSVALDEKSTISITYAADSENQVYRLDGGKWEPYTGPFEVGKNTYIEAYATATRTVTRGDGTKYNGQTDGSASKRIYDSSDYHDYRISLSGKTNIDVTEKSDVYVSTDPNLQELSYSTDGGVTWTDAAVIANSYYKLVELHINEDVIAKAKYVNNDGIESTTYATLAVGEDKDALRVSITTKETILDNTTTPVTLYTNYPVQKLEYSIDGGTTWNNYDAPFNVSNDTLVLARAEKINGDGSIQKKNTSKYIDTTALNVNYDVTNVYYYWGGNYYVKVDQYANVSINSNYPTARLQYSYDNSTWHNYYGTFKETANKTIYVKATYTDSKNILRTVSKSFKIVHWNRLAGPKIITSRTNASLDPVTITLNSDHPGDIYYYIDGGSRKTYTEPFTIDKNATISAYYERTSDGLKSDTSSSVIDIIRDPALPHITFEVTPSDPRTSSQIVDGCVTVKINYTYPNSGYYYFSDDWYWTYRYNNPITVCSNKTITAYAENANGKTVESIVINNVKPKIKRTLDSEIIIDPAAQNKNNSVEEVTVTLTFDDDATVKQYRIGTDGPYDYTGPFTVNKNTTIRLYEEDDIGNTGSNSKRIDFLAKGITDPEIKVLPDNSTRSTVDDVTINYDESATIKKYQIGNGEIKDYTGPFKVYSNQNIYAYSKNADDEEAYSNYLVSNIIGGSRSGSGNGTGGSSGSDNDGTQAVNTVVIEQGGYYLIKLSFPNTSDPNYREYKYGETGEWKKYPKDGILLINPEYEDQLLDDSGKLAIKIKDENNQEISFNGDHYIIDDSLVNIIANIFIRWETKNPDTPIIIPQTTNWVSALDIDIEYPLDMEEYKYKIVYADGTTTGWKDYKGTLTIDSNGATIYAKCMDELEVWSEIAEFNVTNVDDGNPGVKYMNVIKTTSSSIKVSVDGLDEESGIKYYYYSTDAEHYSVSPSKEITYTGLSANTEYTLYVYTQDNVGNKSEAYHIDAKTNSIAKPTLEFEPDLDTWSSSKDVTISHEDPLLTLYYSLDNGSTWEEYTSKVTLNENCKIMAKADDGTNVSKSPVYNITTIDTTKPTMGNVIYAPRSSRLIINANGIDKESGIDYYMYSLDGLSYVNDDDSHSFTNLKSNTEYTVYVKAVNKAGIESDVKSISAKTNDISEISYQVSNPSNWSYTKDVTIN